ncbi:uncharacterized protein LOC131694093 isoform X1 [Topomyia yanbarensis]|uniref:uncharacterized protein LOC131694093 isoform X1 n=1 Tax=Topomyia yanbarensis TaxID=2498891 RepID=UPI00273B4D92|nr:uncharacterized protein LOC131694093 isoform X1 [Topomyia yanbarensis]XP_058838467.1 uncharacterized protein LOC131694093 isoform X1 [Topomyia yanbarensis]XP_058838477.1 uncharacterized protein LOC131694093 isoform X1 [Topomyia yanbarensis]
MDKIKEVVDGESYQALVGKSNGNALSSCELIEIYETVVRCPVRGCSAVVPGEPSSFRSHISTAHGIKTSVRNSAPIACGICNITFAYYKNFWSHIKQKHIDSIEGIEPSSSVSVECPISDPSMDMEVEYDESHESAGSITNPHFYDEPICLNELKAQMADTVTSLRANLSLPESRIESFLETSIKLLNNYQCYVLAELRRFLQQMSIPEDNRNVVDFINSLELSDPFSDVKTLPDNISYLSFKANGAVPFPQEIVLGHRTVTQIVPRSCNSVAKKSVRKVVKDVLHYIPIHEMLELIMRDEAARCSVLSEIPRSDGVLCGFKDGLIFKSDEYFQKYPFALRIILHLDEVEYINPLASRKGKKKLTNVSFKLQNFDPIVNSSLSRVYLSLAVQSNVLKKYGYKRVFSKMLEDLRSLESDAGIRIRLKDNSLYTLHAVVVNVAGDTAALHELIEIMGPQSKLFCRVCYISRDYFRNGSFGNVFPHRTSESIQSDLFAVREHRKMPKECGVISDCCLHVLRFFHYGKIRSMDPMHDLCEGVNMMVIKMIFYDVVVVQKLISCEEINEMIDDFEYGSTERENKPSANFTLIGLKSKGHAISQSASQCWLLLRALPFIFGHIISHNNNYTRIISVLLKIKYFSFSMTLTQLQVNELEEDIHTFYILFKVCFPTVNPTNKIHHLCHYADIFRMNGTMTNCFIIEGKFKESKGQSKTCNNFKNLTYSITKRANLKQINSIISHSYCLNVHVAKTTASVSKQYLKYSKLIEDLPETILIVNHLTINGTMFQKGTVVKYEINHSKHFGVFECSIKLPDRFICIIQKLQILDFDVNANSLKVLQLDEMVRIDSSALFTKKTYNFWKYYPYNGSSYISFKYVDDYTGLTSLNT